MNFYQVNQNLTFEREFGGGYLCSPSGNRGGWPLMKELQDGDILFNYNSTRGAVLGISRVVNIGQHKGVAGKSARVIAGTQCIQYAGRHLSEADFSAEDQDHYRLRYPSYLEVHTAALHTENLGKLFARTPQMYLVKIGDQQARQFLEDKGIGLDSLNGTFALVRHRA